MAVSTTEDVISGSIWSNLHPFDLKETNAPAAGSGSYATHIFNPKGSLIWWHKL